MKDSLLLIMTPSMSLEKWNARGQLFRELKLYSELHANTDLNIIIFSYGRNDTPYLDGYPQFTVLNMPNWIPKFLPFKLQNFIYHIISLFIYSKQFNSVLIAKTNQFRSAEFGLLFKLVYRKPLVVRMGFYYSHFQGLTRIQRLKEKIAFKFSDLIITTSSEAAAFIQKTYRVSGDKLLFMCNNIDLSKFRPMDIAKKYDLIFVGKLEKQKNIDLLLKIVSGSAFRTLIIGKGPLQNLVAEALIKNPNITYLERVDNSDLPYYYNSAKAFLLPSEYEGNPKVLLEAMACSLPCIITNVPGIRECITENETGIYINEDLNYSKTKISQLLSNEDDAKRIGINALKWISEQGNAVKNIEKEIQYYSFLGYSPKHSIS